MLARRGLRPLLVARGVSRLTEACAGCRQLTTPSKPLAAASGAPPPSSSSSSNAGGGGPPAFNDFRVAYSSKSVGELVRSLIVFRLCGWGWLVRNSEPLLKTANALLGRRLVSAVVRPTFFAHFCAGEDAQGIAPSLRKLREHGIGGILDYAAEADLSEEGGEGDAAAEADTAATTTAAGAAAAAQAEEIPDAARRVAVGAEPPRRCWHILCQP
jgi:proline dehydrogenase